MANYHLLDQPTVVLAAQADSYVDQVLADLADHEIESQIELLGASSQAYQRFYGRLGLPIHQPMVFAGLPLATMWNRYQRDVTADLHALYTQTRTAQIAVDQASTFADAEVAQLRDAVQSLAAQVSHFNPTGPTRAGLVSFNLADTFEDTSKIDTAASTLHVAARRVQLAVLNMQDYSQDLKLTVDDDYMQAALAASNPGTGAIGSGSSNGFPGNTHEVTVTENNGTPTTDGLVQLTATPGTLIAFAGDQGLHADPAVILDGQDTTWFEYEVCNLPEALKLNPCLGYGFTIDVPALRQGDPTMVSWYAFHERQQSLGLFPASPNTATIHDSQPEIDSQGQPLGPLGNAIASSGIASPSGAPQVGGVLRLVLLGTLATPRPLTRIEIDFQALNNKRPVVQAVQVRSTTTPDWVTAHPSSRSSTEVAGIDSPLDTYQLPDEWTIPPTTVEAIRILVEQPQSYATQIGHTVWLDGINGSSQLSVLDALVGNAVSPDGHHRIDGPRLSLHRIVGGATSVEQSLDGDTQTSAGPFLEAFAGWRYAIAIRNIRVAAVNYAATGTLTSKDFQVPLDITGISLVATENLLGEADGEAIAYEISLDGGTTWYPIAPQSHYTSTKPRRYAVNRPSPGGDATLLVTPGYDAITQPAVTIRLRATMNRSSTQESTTPTLEQYVLQLEGRPL